MGDAFQMPMDRIARHPQDAVGIALDMALYGDVYQELHPTQTFTPAFFERLDPVVQRGVFNRYYTEKHGTASGRRFQAQLQRQPGTGEYL